ncbi:MAG: hypothetical protein MMC33_001995 [Icmadophila ericetorum]|nr:hypothetical protein [Icmadophila ericetorum]
MDEPGERDAKRSSRIPQLSSFSKLPLPSSMQTRTAKATGVEKSKPHNEAPVVPGRRPRPQSMQINGSTSNQSMSYGGNQSAISNASGFNLRDARIPGPLMQDQDLVMQSTPADSSVSNAAQTSLQRNHPAAGTRISRPVSSLPERAAELQSQIPSITSPRMNSGFSSHDAPLKPPSRPASAMNQSRPGISTTSGYSNGYGMQRSGSISQGIPRSPSKKTLNAPSSGGIPTTPIVPRPSIRRPTNPTKATNPKSSEEVSPTSPSNIPMLSPISQVQGKAALAPIKTQAIGSLRMRPVAKPTVGSNKATGETNANPKIKSKIAPKNVLSTQLSTNQESEGDSERANLASSMALRKTIADAKAARRGKPGQGVGLGIGNGPATMDPFALDQSAFNHEDILRKRVNTARADGYLNVAAFGLKKLPPEILHMYDQEVVSASGVPWFENVDLVKFNAADNELTNLEDEAFPDVSPTGENADDDYCQVFAGLEKLDLHGNQLMTVPIGFRRLSRLTSLNLSKNNITNAAFEIICQIESLKELHLGDNALSGDLPSSLGEMVSLEVLDLHGNKISHIPLQVEKLSKLKVINISDNKLSSIPLTAMTRLPLVELSASRNRLDGILLPLSFPRLQKLDVSENALVSLYEGGLDLPALQWIDVSKNRISTLPEGNWTQLISLLASHNQLNSLPNDFVSLQHLRVADLSCNSLTSLDERIGLMDNLKTLMLENNPLRERRFLKMETETLKLELQARMSEATTAVEEENESPTYSLKPLLLSGGMEKKSGWIVKAGVLDRSRAKLQTIDHADLKDAIDSGVTTLALHHNLLNQIPSAIAVLGSTLFHLDLSNNKLRQNELYTTEPIILPHLQTLNVSSNGLTSLNLLCQSLSAPELSTLNISFNRLATLPILRPSYPSLKKVLATNNAMKSLDVEAVRGLNVLDASSNDIEHLPPKLALLQGELRTLMVTGNKFRVPGWGILEKGTEEVLKWLRMKIPAGELPEGEDLQDMN